MNNVVEELRLKTRMREAMRNSAVPYPTQAAVAKAELKALQESYKKVNGDYAPEFMPEWLSEELAGEVEALVMQAKKYASAAIMELNKLIQDHGKDLSDNQKHDINKVKTLLKDANEILITFKNKLPEVSESEGPVNEESRNEFNVSDDISGYDDALVIFLADEKNLVDKVQWISSVAKEAGCMAEASGKGPFDNRVFVFSENSDGDSGEIKKFKKAFNL